MSKFSVSIGDKVAYSVQFLRSISMCHSQGLLRSKLDDMEPADAQALYFATAPQQPDQREGAA